MILRNLSILMSLTMLQTIGNRLKSIVSSCKNPNKKQRQSKSSWTLQSIQNHFMKNQNKKFWLSKRKNNLMMTQKVCKSFMIQRTKRKKTFTKPIVKYKLRVLLRMKVKVKKLKRSFLKSQMIMSQKLQLLLKNPRKQLKLQYHYPLLRIRPTKRKKISTRLYGKRAIQRKQSA